MCQREQILSATDILTKIPDEEEISAQELGALATVLRLLSRLLDQQSSPQPSPQ